MDGRLLQAWKGSGVRGKTHVFMDLKLVLVVASKELREEPRRASEAGVRAQWAGCAVTAAGAWWGAASNATERGQESV